MDRRQFESALWGIAHGPMGEPPAAIGRIPQEICRVALGWTEPRELATGEVAVAAFASEGPAYALGDALFGHPEAFVAEFARRLALWRPTAALAHGRPVLRKLAAFVPGPTLRRSATRSQRPEPDSSARTATAPSFLKASAPSRSSTVRIPTSAASVKGRASRRSVLSPPSPRTGRTR